MPLEIRDLSHVYAQGMPYEFTALKDISLSVEDQSFIGIIGHTGSGKSTLIRHFNGLLKPTTGCVLLNNVDIFDKTKIRLKDVRAKVGICFQYPEHQLFEATVAKDVAFGPVNLGLSEEEIEQRVKDAIQLVGLDYEKVKDRSPFELSGGQMRRVAIAGVLAMKPDILIMDEPTAGLDPHGRDEILSQIRRLHREQKTTVILVSHSMEDIGRLVEKILVMHQGHAVMYDTPEKVFAEIELLESIGLAVPEVTYLMARLHQINPEFRKDIFTVEAAEKEIIRVLGDQYHV